jgi:excinuclease ABC subunit C
VTAGFEFEQEAAFETGQAQEILRGVPEGPGVFGLFGTRAADQPYLTRGVNLRRRMMRLLSPPEVLRADGTPVLSKRLNLRERVVRIGWSVTGSEFESLLVLYRTTAGIFGYAEARRRLRLGTPFFLRLTTEHAHPRVYSTNRLSKRGLGQMYGPFSSRAAADRYADAVLDLFKLRRCHEDLTVHPEHPGCAYGEMKKCMAPCNTGCTAEEYATEAQAVKAFFETRGESLLAGIRTERERASDEMDFERAAALHRQWEKVKAATAMADELVRPVPELRAVVVQAAAVEQSSREEQDSGSWEETEHAEEAAVFLLERGCLVGPGRMSTLGVRAVKEQTSVGSSLFAQPLMLQAVPLAVGEGGIAGAVTDAPEERVARVLGELQSRTRGEIDVGTLSDHLSLFQRWYYRPEKQRSGEVFLPNADGSWPVRRILRGAARVAMGEPKVMAETDRAGAKSIRTKVLHEGRPDVERVVPIIAKAPDRPEGFRSRRLKKISAGEGGTELEG